VLEPFASGVTTAVSSIAGELPDFTHIIIHGSRNWTESAEKVKERFPAGVAFVEWKSAVREISLVKDWKALWELVRLLKPYTPKNVKKKNQTAVVHLHSSKAGFLGRLACRILGIKAVIYTPHCGAFLRTDISSLKQKVYRFFEWLGGCFGGRVVGCGPSEGELYKKLGKNTTYVSNGVKLKEETDANSTGKEKQSYFVQRCLVAFTGIASFQKDPALWSAVAAACNSVAKQEGFSFCWVGDGPLAGELDRECVDLSGWKTAKEVEDLLEKTAVYFSASAWEGLPYGVLEAMNCGCALLLRNVPGNRELVVSGENGWLFDTREEAVSRLTAMLKDREELSLMGKRSREILEQGYSSKQMGDRYRRIYNALAAQRDAAKAYGGGA